MEKTPIRSKLLGILIIILLTSSIWFLALADGTIDLIRSEVSHSLYLDQLDNKKDRLQLEVDILKLQIEKDYREYQLRYLGSKLQIQEQSIQDF